MASGHPVAFKRSEVNSIIEDVLKNFAKTSSEFISGQEIGNALRSHPSMIAVFENLCALPLAECRKGTSWLQAAYRSVLVCSTDWRK